MVFPPAPVIVYHLKVLSAVKLLKVVVSVKVTVILSLEPSLAAYILRELDTANPPDGVQVKEFPFVAVVQVLRSPSNACSFGLELLN